MRTLGVGRIVDLESEWFPTVELTDAKRRLRLQASQLGRRSVFVQSMDDLRYMAVPPRAVGVWFFFFPLVNHKCFTSVPESDFVSSA